MVLPQRPSSAGMRALACKTAVPRDEVLDPDVRRFVRGMAWGGAISAPFWLAILAALIWL